MDYGLETAFREYGLGLDDGNVAKISITRWILLALTTERPLYVRWVRRDSVIRDGVLTPERVEGKWEIWREFASGGVR